MREIETRKSSESYKRKRGIRQIQKGIWKWTETLVDLGQGGSVRTLEEESEEGKKSSGGIYNEDEWDDKTRENS